MLPRILLWKMITIRLFIECFLDAFRDMRHIVKVKFNLLSLVNQIQEVFLPIWQMYTHFLKFTCGNTFKNLGIHR
jgi:hypothetical protein